MSVFLVRNNHFVFRRSLSTALKQNTYPQTLLPHTEKSYNNQCQTSTTPFEVCGPEKGRLFAKPVPLTSEAVERTSLPLQSINHIHSRDSLSLGMLGVSHSVTNNIFEEHLEHTTGFLINKPRYTLHSTSPCQPPNCRFSDALNVIPQHFTVALSTSFTKTFTAFTSSSHYHHATAAFTRMTPELPNQAFLLCICLSNQPMA